MIEKELRAAIVALTTVPSVNFVKALEGTSYPYITLTEMTSPRNHTHDGYDGSRESTFQMTVVGDDYTITKKYAIAIYAIEDYTSDTVIDIQISNESDRYDDQIKAHYTVLDLKVKHQEE